MVLCATFGPPRSTLDLTDMDGIRLPPSRGCLKPSLDQRGNAFGFFLYPPESKSPLPGEPPSSGTVTVTVTGLSRFPTRRISQPGD